MYSVICRKKCCAHYLHCLIQPQIRHLEIQPGTIHHAISFLQSRCRGLQSLVLCGSTHMNPELFIPVFKHFPNLVKIDLSGNVMDDRSFDNIGATCHVLRYLNVSRSTISDLGLRFLSRSQQNVPRCQLLVYINLQKCRITKKGVASFIYYHPLLQDVVYEDTVGASYQLTELGQ